MEDTVYLVGGDHHNGYGLIRHLGENGVPIVCYIVSSTGKSWIATSKYVSEYKIFDSYSSVFDYLITLEHTGKPIIIPYSDNALIELDARQEKLALKYRIPGFLDRPGTLCKYMDKLNQFLFAKRFDIPTAYTNIIDLSTEQNDSTSSLPFPCLLKPRNSSLGKKSDIKVCHNSASIGKELAMLKAKGYSEILVQEYLPFDYEIDVFGGIANGKILSIFPHQILRRWPNVGGTSSFTVTTTDEQVISFSNRILEKVCELGYSGLYDLEIFCKDGKLYLNEINFRNSGSSFRALGQHFYFVFDWYKAVLGMNTPQTTRIPEKNDYTMTEYTDIRHVFCKDISLISWLKDVKKCSSFAIANLSDIKPMVFKLLYGVIRRK